MREKMNTYIYLYSHTLTYPGQMKKIQIHA